MSAKRDPEQLRDRAQRIPQIITNWRSALPPSLAGDVFEKYLREHRRDVIARLNAWVHEPPALAQPPPDPEPTEEAQHLLLALTNETQHLRARRRRGHLQTWIREAFGHLEITAPVTIEWSDTSAVVRVTGLAYEAWHHQLRVLRHALTVPGAPEFTLDLSAISEHRPGDLAVAEIGQMPLESSRRELFARRVERAILSGRSPLPVLVQARAAARLQAVNPPINPNTNPEKSHEH